ncbi:MAG: hypothetical protein IKU70_00215 [Clostridia bacterium]|nr:hypothetical protein [Clostridia bacterium]
MKSTFMRILALLLCICLLPVYAFAETRFEDINDGTPVTHSDFELSFRLYADGWPDDGKLHYQDWETFLNKLSLRGSMDSQSFPAVFDRVYFDGGMYLNDKLTIPFEYDGYSSFRYLRSPALGGASVHFQMFNFFQFMLKPYYYMYMPTQYIALALYPEAWIEMWQKYAQPISAAAAGEGDRVISHDALTALSQQLNDIILVDDYSKAYYFITCLLTDLGMDWTASDKLAAWDLLLEYLDPEQKGMTIAQTEHAETWTVGETVIYEKNAAADETTCRLYLPDPDGYEFSVELRRTASEVTAEMLILLDGEEYFRISAGADGLPEEGQLTAQGNVRAEFSGSALYEEIAPIHVQFDYSRTADALPYDMSMSISLINNETQKPCLGVAYTAAVEELPYTALVERPYDDQEDFFHLNESFIEEYKERFLPALVLAAAPVALEVPAGVLSDAIAYMDETGILAFMGIE